MDCHFAHTVIGMSSFLHQINMTLEFCDPFHDLLDQRPEFRWELWLLRKLTISGQQWRSREEKRLVKVDFAMRQGG